MKALLIDDVVAEELRGYAQGVRALPGPAVGRLIAKLGEATVVDVNEKGQAGALEIVDEWRQRAEKAEAALEAAMGDSDTAISGGMRHMATALQTVVEQLTRAGVPIPGTGRVFPAAVGEMANAAADRIVSQELAIKALAGSAGADVVGEIERTRAWIIDRFAWAHGPSEREAAVCGELAALLEKGSARLAELERAREEVTDELAQRVGERDEWAIRCGHLTEKLEARERDAAGPEPNGGMVVLPLEQARVLREDAYIDVKMPDMGAEDLRAVAALATAIEEAEAR